MRAEDIDTLKPGDRIYRWVLVGTSHGGAYDKSDIQELTVVRVNRTTVTVDTKAKVRLRLPHEMIDGRVDW